jgi:endonuclease G
MSKITAQFQSFSLANMIPQHPCNNEVLWETIESGVRAFVLARNEVYVVTGPIFEGGSLQSIGNGVVVPTKVFKAIYVPALDKAGAYLAENTDNMDWQSISIERLQTLTGVDAFPAISKSVKTDGMGLPLPTAPKFKCRLH